jgi:hypothetical protein
MQMQMDKLGHANRCFYFNVCRFAQDGWKSGVGCGKETDARGGARPG